MNLLPLRALRLRLRLRHWLPVAGACAAAACPCWWLAHDGDGAAAEAATPSKAAERGRSRVTDATARELVGAWSPVIRASDEKGEVLPGLTITGRGSAARSEAFRQLLAGVRHGNAAEFHRLLAAADGEGGGLTDAEWRALLEKWGRLDGAAAAAYLGGLPDGRRWLPGLLRGWASAEPEAARGWFEEKGAALAGAKSAAARGLILGWFQTDPEAAARWLGEQGDLPGYGEIAAVFADAVAATDPAKALERAVAVDGPAARAWAIQSVARQWLEQDEKTALEGLVAAGYSAEEVEGWKEDPDEGYDLLDPPDAGLPGVTVTEE